MNRPEPAMRWLAQVNGTIQPGTRLYVQEAMHFPGHPRPPYSAGDVFNVDPGISSQIPGEIVAVAPGRLTIALEGHERFDIVPTPAGSGPPGFASDVPAEDWVVI